MAPSSGMLQSAHSDVAMRAAVCKGFLFAARELVLKGDYGTPLDRCEFDRRATRPLVTVAAVAFQCSGRIPRASRVAKSDPVFLALAPKTGAPRTTVLAS
jgi:hypothetical protein